MNSDSVGRGNAQAMVVLEMLVEVMLEVCRNSHFLVKVYRRMLFKRRLCYKNNSIAGEVMLSKSGEESD